MFVKPATAVDFFVADLAVLVQSAGLFFVIAARAARMNNLARDSVLCNFPSLWAPAFVGCSASWRWVASVRTNKFCLSRGTGVLTFSLRVHEATWRTISAIFGLSCTVRCVPSLAAAVILSEQILFAEFFAGSSRFHARGGNTLLIDLIRFRPGTANASWPLSWTRGHQNLSSFVFANDLETLVHHLAV